MANEPTKRKVPTKAFQFAGEAPAEPVIGEAKATDGQTLYPFAMVARTGGIANHWYWGRCVHDMGGLRLSKERMPIDFCHDSRDVIGFGDQFDALQGELKVAGQLVSTKPDDRAETVAKQGKGGIPFQASINMRFDDLVIENLPEGVSTVVNGQTVEGPVTIFRQWSIAGVAMCPYGSDGNTSVEFNAGEAGDVDVSILQFGASSMSTAATAPAAPPANPPADTTPGQPGAGQLAATPVAPPAKTGQDYLTAFGDLGGRWFAEGKAWDEAQALFTKHLQDQVATLGAQVTAKDAEIKGLKDQFAAVSGGKDPVSFAAAGGPQSPAPKTPVVSNLDKFAASLAFAAGGPAKDAK